MVGGRVVAEEEQWRLMALICAGCRVNAEVLAVTTVTARARKRPEKLCYNQGLPKRRALLSAGLFARRGVAQPGRAPGSGPGGRRFKSSLPDQIIFNLLRIPTASDE